MSSPDRTTGRAPGRHRAGFLDPDGPLRHTRRRSPSELATRAWRLLGMHLLLPGSVQVVAGRPLLGRIAIAICGTMWAVVVGALVLWLVAREVVVTAVSATTGRPIRYVVQIDIASLGRLVDTLGGIEVDVPEHTFDDGFAAGPTRLTGTRVAAYLRAPGSGRTSQQLDRVLQVQTALLSQANPANVLLHFQRIAQASSRVVRTDIPQPVVVDLAVLALKTQDQPVRQVRLGPPAVADPADPDWTAIRRLVARATS